MMLKDALTNVIFPAINDLIKAICNMAEENAHIPMLSRTHGQVNSYFLRVSNYLHLLLTRLFLIPSL